MIATCKTHGETEFHLDKNHNAWCLKCRNEQIKAYLATDEGKAKLSHVMQDAMLPPFGTGTKIEGFVSVVGVKDDDST